MTPSMRLGDLVRQYRNHPDSKIIMEHLNEAFSLGHEFGLERAVEEAAANNPFAAITQRLRVLKVERVKNVRTTSEDFL